MEDEPDPNAPLRDMIITKSQVGNLPASQGEEVFVFDTRHMQRQGRWLDKTRLDKWRVGARRESVGPNVF